jgi:hypothetical protein
MYTDPACVRQGIGRMILDLCEGAARKAGFRRTEMMATLSGEPLYRACGYLPIEHVELPPVDGVSVPLIRMAKALGSAQAAHVPRTSMTGRDTPKPVAPAAARTAPVTASSSMCVVVPQVSQIMKMQSWMQSGWALAR